MGYESRVYVVLKSDKLNWAETIACVNLCVMGYGNGWVDLFKTPVDFDFYPIDDTSDDCEYIKEDLYGKRCKYATINDVLDWLEKSDRTYRRQQILYGLLKSFDPECWKDDRVLIVHYGY